MLEAAVGQLDRRGGSRLRHLHSRQRRRVWWREDGKRAWLWAAVAARLSVFLIRRFRARPVLAELISGPAGV